MRIDGLRTAAVASGSLSVVACAALTASGCGSGADLMTGLAATDQQSVGSSLQAIATPPGAGSAMVVTPEQQRYLDALDSAGVRPSSTLAALSIGSNVCQARAARQPDQAVWDFVVPMVRGDVDDMDDGGDMGGDVPGVRRAGSTGPPAGEVNAVTANYIRIATEKLC